MKCRLIGDLETTGTIGKAIMNVSRLLPSHGQFSVTKSQMQKTTRCFDWKMFFIPFTKSTKVSFLFLLFTLLGI